MYDWLLFLHVISAFALVAGYVVYTAAILAGRRLERPSEAVALYRVTRPADLGVAIGMGGTIVFGVWLAIYVDGYHVWDGWIVAAIVLWAVLGELGRREDAAYRRARDLARELVAAGGNEPSGELRALLRSRSGLNLHITASVTILAILVLMIYKPGA